MEVYSGILSDSGWSLAVIGPIVPSAFSAYGSRYGSKPESGAGKGGTLDITPGFAVRRFDERVPVISGFWQNIYLVFCRGSGESCAEIAPLRQRKGLRGKRSREACL